MFLGAIRIVDFKNLLAPKLLKVFQTPNLSTMRALLFLIVFLPAGAYAQSTDPRNEIRVGINRAFFGSGDVVGPALYAEYSYRVNPYLSVAPRLISGTAARERPDLYDHASSFAANVSARITPSPRVLSFLSLDVGGLYHRFASTYGSINSTTPDGISNDYSEHRQQNLWGFVGAVNTELVHQEAFTLGARLELLTSLSGGYLSADSYQIGIFYSRRF